MGPDVGTWGCPGEDSTLCRWPHSRNWSPQVPGLVSRTGLGSPAFLSSSVLLLRCHSITTMVQKWDMVFRTFPAVQFQNTPMSPDPWPLLTYFHLCAQQDFQHGARGPATWWGAPSLLSTAEQCSMSVCNGGTCGLFRLPARMEATTHFQGSWTPA